MRKGEGMRKGEEMRNESVALNGCTDEPMCT